jgi:hypothetical protein
MNTENPATICTLDATKIIEYSKISIEGRLQWLEDALLFNSLVFSEQEKSVREKMKELV